MALPVFSFGTAAPTDTNVYWEAGSIVRNSAPSAGGVEGWICTAAGYPGTWKAMGVVEATAISTVTAAAALTYGSKVYSLTGAGQYTLFSAASVAAGAEIKISGTGVTVTLNPASSQTLAGGGTTLASAGSSWVSNGANTWIRVG